MTAFLFGGYCRSCAIFRTVNAQCFCERCVTKYPEHVGRILAAQGIEAATAAETTEIGSVHESPVAESDAPKGGQHD